MGSKIKTFAAAVVLLGLLVAFAFTISSRVETGSPDATQPAKNQEQQVDGNLENKPAPAFSLKNLKGETVSLADYQGQLVFINFWATWCEPCKEEMPSMQRLRAKMQGRPFEILAISLDKDPVSAVPQFTEKYKLELNFPVLQDPEQEIAKKHYRTTGVPESFIVGADGKVIKHVIGSYEWDSEAIVNYFEELLKEIPA